MAQTPAIAALERQGITHRIISFSADGHAGNYGRSAAAELDQAEEQVFKTLMVELDNGQLVVAIVPVAGHLDLKAVARAFSARKAKMADPGKAQRSSGYVVGGISPLGQKKPCPTLVDESALALQEIFVSGGKRGLEIALSPNDLIAVTKARTAAIAAPD